MGNDDFLENSAEERLQKAAVARIFRVAREKRTRSFFFSNDDLLELLALAEKFLGVPPHPRKFFESIDSLVFASNLEVAAINSEETETAPSGEFCGNVENWLGAVKKLMLDSVRHQMDESVEAGTTDVMGLMDTGDLSWQDRKTVITEFEWGSQLWHDEMMDVVQASNESWCQQLPPKVIDHTLKNGGGGGGGITKTGTSDNGMCGNDPSNCEYVSNISVNNVLGCWRSSSSQQIEYVKRENDKLNQEKEFTGKRTKDELGFLKTGAKLLDRSQSGADTSRRNMEDIVISGIREREAHVAPTMQEEKRRVLGEIGRINGLVKAVASTRSNEVDQPQKENAQLKSSVQMLRSDLMWIKNDACMEEYDMFQVQIAERSQMKIGLDKLLPRRNEVEVLERRLEDLQSELERTAEEVEEMIVGMAKEKKEAEKKKKLASDQVQDIHEALMNVADAQKRLDEALAAVDAAEASAMNVSREDIIEIKSFVNPRNIIKALMAATCILFAVQPSKISKKGNKFADYWLASKKLISKPTRFLEDLRNFDKTNIKENAFRKIEHYINKKFTARDVEKTSRACVSMHSWVESMYAYHKVGSQVATRRVALEEAMEKVTRTTTELSVTKRKLRWREAKIDSLEEKFNQAMAKKDALSKQVKDCRTKRQIVEEIIGALSGKSLAVPPPLH
ncbi:hypothetical protein BSKO_05787 [Bryopsis sp. KO-2023]|nr:hypothetical protein BSKO_05787 [Bryopsis sp. KO-2023]